jgi:hypothetical protein
MDVKAPAGRYIGNRGNQLTSTKLRRSSESKKLTAPAYRELTLLPQFEAWRHIDLSTVLCGHRGCAILPLWERLDMAFCFYTQADAWSYRCRPSGTTCRNHKLSCLYKLSMEVDR